MNVATDTVELGDSERTPTAAGICKRSGKLWPAFKRIGTFPGLDLDELADDFKFLGRGEASQRLALRV
jgi:hypothetical protein